MNKEIIPGDIVKLKSGGPSMTVDSVTSNGLECLWFYEAEGPFRACFWPASLTHINPEDKKDGPSDI